ncbi:hypothetical protein DFH09DRAFT_1265819 [Mycena vulgaris]|nr:hypothetical protein DFH09DRAFT_1265819 [Mycena vulgaris]
MKRRPWIRPPFREGAKRQCIILLHSTWALLPTPLWNDLGIIPREQIISIRIDNTSVFVPGSGPPQYGFRRTEFIAQKNGSSAALEAEADTGLSIFHFSIKADLSRPLNYSHEYQIVFIDPNDGSHVFGIQLGSPFANSTGQLPAKNAHSFKVLDHGLNVLFTAPFIHLVWHSFAITMDWDSRTLLVAYSLDGRPLKAVTSTLPLLNPEGSPTDQSDVVHHGIQEGTTEGLFYSGVFVERRNPI